ncbi:hypothetical protein K1T73_11285 [Roseovarius sp. SCSIO 43702]|uniref:hypothetical protein n=1 Tax=Roseovarius sp. SCSIO 43702 TaxID=2823043 RepID=UPI001C72FD2E|nr:hypothetical protein [Roseovarius sp. SCSIO 43702]QYX55671.1 hypothetical protein K1T73_11285 [Roseovarius sp. SCSIO 43702]
MRIIVALMVVSSLTLAGCAGWRDSRVNPGNWFGGGAPKRAAQPTTSTAASNPLIPDQSGSIFRRKSAVEVYEGTPIHSVTSLALEPSSGGAILRVTGVPLRQGAFDVRLTPVSGRIDQPVNGVLAYRLEAIQPTTTPQGPERTRRVHAGRFLTDETLRDVRVISVRGAGNVITTRR